MKTLKNILPPHLHWRVQGDENVQIKDLTINSAAVESGFAFFAIKGTQTDGHLYIPSAIKAGAAVIVCEKLPENIEPTVTFLVCENVRLCMGYMSSAFFNFPSKQMEVIGVTGTNGKTTVCTLLKNAASYLGFKCGLIGTVQIEMGQEIIPATHTTPDCISLHRLLHQMLEADCSHVFMEVSSHAIDQQRIAGIFFRGTVFTNISHDHLDYHKTFANYIKAKKQLFDDLSSEAFALVNTDDKNGLVMLQNTKATKLTYSLTKLADYKAKIMEQDLNGMLLQINSHEFYTPVVGRFNGYNLAATFGVLDQLGFLTQDILLALSSVKGAEGRLDCFLAKNGVLGVVDYAHTPDALENVLLTLNLINTHDGNIITVVGCGGNRDAAKRPIMAKIASELSNRLIITSDNPRNEDADTIITEMEQGIPIHKKINTLSIADRKSAIKTACAFAVKGDIILIAGKGHEKYQEIKGVKHPFDDKALLIEFLTQTN